jgi:hypothetical protein
MNRAEAERIGMQRHALLPEAAIGLLPTILSVTNSRDRIRRPLPARTSGTKGTILSTVTPSRPAHASDAPVIPEAAHYRHFQAGGGSCFQAPRRARANRRPGTTLGATPRPAVSMLRSGAGNACGPPPCVIGIPDLFAPRKDLLAPIRVGFAAPKFRRSVPTEPARRQGGFRGKPGMSRTACRDERHQVELLMRFQHEGLNCRALVS